LTGRKTIPGIGHMIPQLHPDVVFRAIDELVREIGGAASAGARGAEHERAAGMHGAERAAGTGQPVIPDDCPTRRRP